VDRDEGQAFGWHAESVRGVAVGLGGRLPTSRLVGGKHAFDITVKARSVEECARLGYTTVRQRHDPDALASEARHRGFCIGVRRQLDEGIEHSFACFGGGLRENERGCHLGYIAEGSDISRGREGEAVAKQPIEEQLERARPSARVGERDADGVEREERLDGVERHDGRTVRRHDGVHSVLGTAERGSDMFELPQVDPMPVGITHGFHATGDGADHHRVKIYPRSTPSHTGALRHSASYRLR
jgi:hypothetical protein